MKFRVSMPIFCLAHHMCNLPEPATTYAFPDTTKGARICHGSYISKFLPRHKEKICKMLLTSVPLDDQVNLDDQFVVKVVHIMESDIVDAQGW